MRSQHITNFFQYGSIVAVLMLIAGISAVIAGDLSYYSQDYKKYKSRKQQYQGKGLGLPQIGSSPRQQFYGFEPRQLTGRQRSPTEARQLQSKRRFIPFSDLKWWREKRANHCVRKPGSYTFEDLFIPSIKGAPPIAILLPQERFAAQYDPNSFFSRSAPANEEKNTYGIIIESEPEDYEITVDISQN